MSDHTQDNASSGNRLCEWIDDMPLPLYTTDATGMVTSFNHAAVMLAGRVPEIGRDRWCVTSRLYWPDGRLLPHEDCPMAIAIKENRNVRGVEAIAERPNGERFPFRPHPTPIRGASGAVVGGFNMLVDLTHRAAAMAWRKALVAQHLKQAETIQYLVEAVLLRAQRRSPSVNPQQVLHATLRQMAEIAAAHGLLVDAGAARIDSWDVLSTSSMSLPLEILEHVELESTSTAGDIAGESVMPLVLIMQELIANAATHGGHGRAKAAVKLRLQKNVDEYVLSVEDDGPGFTSPTSRSKSFGLELVRSIARLLNGVFEVETTPSTRCTVRFPEPPILN